METTIKTFRTNSGEWCAEAYVQGTMLEVGYGPTSIAALEDLWRQVARAHRVQSAGLDAVYREVFRVDPWREWRALGRRLARPFRRLVGRAALAKADGK